MAPVRIGKADKFLMTRTRNPSCPHCFVPIELNDDIVSKTSHGKQKNLSQDMC